MLEIYAFLSFNQGTNYNRVEKRIRFLLQLSVFRSGVDSRLLGLLYVILVLDGVMVAQQKQQLLLTVAAGGSVPEAGISIRCT